MASLQEGPLALLEASFPCEVVGTYGGERCDTLASWCAEDRHLIGLIAAEWVDSLVKELQHHSSC